MKTPSPELSLKWSARAVDVRIDFPVGSVDDGDLLDEVFVRTQIERTSWNFLQELVSRGYDITTIKFSIKKKVKK